MVYAIHTCALLGLEPHPVVCEVDLACQLPTFTLVGLPSSLTQESRERIRAAVVNSGFEWPARKVTVNLLPADLPKWGCHFELAMALGVLGASIEQPLSTPALAIGELSLSGQIRPCGWFPAISDWLSQQARQLRSQGGEPLLVLAHEEDIRDLGRAAPELARDCELAPAVDLRGAFAQLLEAAQRARAAGAPSLPGPAAVAAPASSSFQRLSEVRGEPLGVVAALAAVAGGHHALFAGAHGMGKSMLVRSICEALPAQSPQDAATRAGILRAFGKSFGEAIAESSSRRPVVSLQASISRAALEGALLASGQVLPGELTRAHLGVLVVDELLEYRRDVVEALRQPLDDGLVRLQRAKFRVVLPARFQLLASTNLCPCGGFGTRDCRCGINYRETYQRKLSGPILDRFDLIVLVGARSKKLITPIPGDLAPLVEELVKPDTWPDRVAALSAAPEPAEQGAELWSQFPCEASDRGKLRLARVSRTLAGLLGQPRTVKHLRLAELVRQDLEGLLYSHRQVRIIPKSEEKPIEINVLNN